MTISCYLTCSADFWGGKEHDYRPSAILRESYEAFPKQQVQLVDSPEKADVILFAESHRNDARSGYFLEQVRKTPIYQEFSAKTAVHSGYDRPFPIIPGIYPSLSQVRSTGLQCSGGPYLVDPNPFLEQDVGWNGEVFLLASFLGACQHKPPRLRLLKLHRPEMPIVDSGDEFVGAIRAGDAITLANLKRGFVRQMLESKFILCPRGAGRSSFRIFEAMQLARVPVIISDGWLPPPGPTWSEFAIFVPAKDLLSLPDILKSHEPTWQHKGSLARKAWETFYSPTHIAQTIIRAAFESVNTSAMQQSLHGTIARLHFFELAHLRQWVRQSRRSPNRNL
jgi:Exostosin family